MVAASDLPTPTPTPGPGPTPTRTPNPTPNHTSNATPTMRTPEAASAAPSAAVLTPDPTPTPNPTPVQAPERASAPESPSPSPLSVPAQAPVPASNSGSASASASGSAPSPPPSIVEQAKQAAAHQAVADYFHPSFRLVGIGSGTTIRYVVQEIARLVRAYVRAQEDALHISAVTVGGAGPGSFSAGTAADAGVRSESRAGSVAAASGASPRDHVHQPSFVPTSIESRGLIMDAGLKVVEIDEVEAVVASWASSSRAGAGAGPDFDPRFPLEVAFDGADEVDEDLNCIKGGGACLFREKLVVEMARRFVCVADYRKAQRNLLTFWKTIPIEVAPMAAPAVLTRLRKELGSPSPAIRLAPPSPSAISSSYLVEGGVGPVRRKPLFTDQAFFIIDAPFKFRLPVAGDGKGKGKEKGSERRESADDRGGAGAADGGFAGAGEGDETEPIGTITPAELGRRIRLLEGVLEVGLFTGLDGDEAAGVGAASGSGGGAGDGDGDTETFGVGHPIARPQRPVAVYFGMKDGGVSVRRKEC